MAEKNGEGLDSLFALSKRRRTQALLDLIERHRMRNPPTVRFALAGVVTALDGELIQDVAEAVVEAIKVRLLKMPEDES